MRFSELFVCGAFAAVLLIAGRASAQSRTARAARAARAARTDQFVEFSDELLDADLPAPFGDPLFTGHRLRPRTLLIRPRTNFVPELYKSVEQI